MSGVKKLFLKEKEKRHAVSNLARVSSRIGGRKSKSILL